MVPNDVEVAVTLGIVPPLHCAELVDGRGERLAKLRMHCHQRAVTVTDQLLGLKPQFGRNRAKRTHTQQSAPGSVMQTQHMDTAHIPTRHTDTAQGRRTHTHPAVRTPSSQHRAA